ncbi:hypothetical protein BRD00_11950 [Halobacteriales archaeon QS_8_69_26]|nr:MAG: hypothetical protein BRD00_11950 [Halobacteriales archaeon QS_8_69_26]
MPLQRQWRDLDRSTIGRAPERYGVYELGIDGEVVEVGAGVLRRELKDALTYADADQVRWEESGTRERAKELAEEHRDRLD